MAAGIINAYDRWYIADHIAQTKSRPKAAFLSPESKIESATYLALRDDIDATILCPSLSGIVGSNRVSFALADNLNIRCRYSGRLGNNVVCNGLCSTLREP